MTSQPLAERMRPMRLDCKDAFLIRKLRNASQLFPYMPQELTPSLMDLYKASFLRADLKYKLLFRLSRMYKDIFPKQASSYSPIFDHEIKTLKKSPNSFIEHRYLRHVLGIGSASHSVIINDKAKFHAFADYYSLPTPPLLGHIMQGKIQLIEDSTPWENSIDFLIKPTRGYQSIGIYDFRFTGDDKYELLEQCQEVAVINIPQFLKRLLGKGDYIIQRRISPPAIFLEQGIRHVPILRVLSRKNATNITLINPVLILHQEKKYLNSRLSNKDFYAVNEETGDVMGKIVFTHAPKCLSVNQLPYWPHLTDILRKAHSLLHTVPIIGWDVALSETGYIIIEANQNPWLEIHQKFPFDSPCFIQKLLENE